MELETHEILDTSKLFFTGDFDAQVMEILTRVRLTRNEVESLQILIDDVERALSYLWQDCRVHPFGSIVTGLGIKTSDIDCYVELPPYYGFECRKKGPILLARNQLRKDGGRFTQLLAIVSAKVPIIKFMHRPTGFNCDINFTSMSGVRNSKLIAFMLSLDPRALPLAIIIKYWSKVYNFTGTNLMPNYGLTMMVIFYLQVKTVLPSVEKLQQHREPNMVENWNTVFNDYIVHVTDNTETLYQLLGGFFNYYKTFDYRQNVISPFMGCPLKRHLFTELNTVPGAFHLYASNVTNHNCKAIRLDTSICIQDPFDHSRNCTMGVIGKLFIKMDTYFKLAATVFANKQQYEFLKALFTMEPQIKSEVAKNTKTLFKNRANQKKKKQQDRLKAQQHYNRWRTETRQFKGI